MFYWTIDKRFIFRNIIFILMVALALGSCNVKTQPAAFYPIDSLVTLQIHYLTEIKAGLFKQALLSGKTDTLTYPPEDTLGWIKELDIFRKLQVINKPINKGSYLVADGLADPRSNLTFKAFNSLKKLPVVYLRVYYQGKIEKLRKIEALYDEENSLYESARLLSMNFQQINNKTVLTSYAIKGGQKMIFGDSVSFYIKGNILIN